MASDPQKPMVPMLLMVVSMGLSLAMIYAMVAHDHGSTAGAIMVALLRAVRALLPV